MFIPDRYLAARVAAPAHAGDDLIVELWDPIHPQVHDVYVVDLADAIKIVTEVVARQDPRLRAAGDELRRVVHAQLLAMVAAPHAVTAVEWTPSTLSPDPAPTD